MRLDARVSTAPRRCSADRGGARRSAQHPVGSKVAPLIAVLSVSGTPEFQWGNRSAELASQIRLGEFLSVFNIN